MRTQLEETVTGVLRTHGDAPVDVTALRVGSIARARTIQRRRVGLIGVAAAVAVVGATTAVSLRPGADGSTTFAGTHPSPSGPALGRDGLMTLLPLGAAPGAAVQPGLVGKDPGTFHFEVNTSALGATGISYSNHGGVETADVWTGGTNQFTTWYDLSQQPMDGDSPGVVASQPHDAPTTTEVFGRPATLVRYPQGLDGTHALYRITWQPVDGLWASVETVADDQAAVTTAVEALKLSRSQRCVAPFQLSSLPTGYTWTGCAIGLGPSKPWETSDVWLTDAHGQEVEISIGNYSTNDPYVANTTVGGSPAEWIDQRQRSDGTGTTFAPANLFIPVRDWVNLDVSGPVAQQGTSSTFTEAAAIQLAMLIDVGANFTDPSTWPVPPVAG